MTTPMQVKIQQTLDKLNDPVQSQDPLDAIAAEYSVAASIASYAEARKNTAKKALEEVAAKQINDTRERAKTHKSKQSGQVSGAVRTVIITCNAPATRLDADAFVNELIKAGVKQAVVEAAREKAMKQSAPATSYAVAEAGSHGK